MKVNSFSGIVPAAELSISWMTTGCSAQWISVALADLPVLTQMALNLAALVATLQTRKQLSPAEALAIQDISAEASKDLTLLQAQGQPEPGCTTEDRESDSGHQSEVAGAVAGGPHQRRGALRRITSAVNLILTTVSSFASLIPQTSTVAPKTARQNAVIAHPLFLTLRT